MNGTQQPEIGELRRRLDSRERYANSTRLRRAWQRPIASSWLTLYRLRKGLPARSTSARLFSGQRMHVVLPEVVSRHLYLYGFFESSLTRALLELVQPGMVFVDVGAHFGYYSLLAHLLVGERGRVFAFEPTPSTFKVLTRNLASLGGVRAESLAAYSGETELVMHDFGIGQSAFNSLLEIPRSIAVNGRAPASQRVVVRGVALDEYFQRAGVAPDFIKIDVESSELEVLHGTRDLLRDRKPVVSVEVGDYDILGAPRSEQIIHYLLDYGYQCFEYDEGALVPHKVRERYGSGNLVFIAR